VYSADAAANNEAPVLLEGLQSTWRLIRGHETVNGAALSAQLNDWEARISMKVGGKDPALSIMNAIRAATTSEDDDSAFFAAVAVGNGLVANAMYALEIRNYEERYDREALNHPGVMIEFKRQDRDLDELERYAVDPYSWDTAIENLYARATGEHIELMPVVRDDQPYINPFTGKPLPRG
jgi:hypothetical protein